MDFAVALLGMLFGGWLFSELPMGAAGALFGAILGFVCWRQIRLERQLAESRGQGLPAAKAGDRTTPPQPAPAPPEFSFEPDPPTELAPRPSPPKPRTVAAKPSPPVSPPAPRQPSPGRKSQPVEWWDILVAYFTGGNVVVRAGAIILFFGIAFLLKYSAERNIVPIELRLLGIATGAVALLLFGWRLRFRRAGYALILQGAAMGILFLTSFAAMRLYQLLPTGVALLLLVGLSILSAALALLQEARVLAVLGVVGGFLAPILTSTGGGDHVMLFGYYALLNLGILIVAWRRSWRELNLLGFLFTFGIGTLWGARNYRPELFASTEPFLLLFFLLYLVIGLLFARNQPFNLRGYVDSAVVFGAPIVCFSLQALLMRPYVHGLAWSALALGLLYGGLAWALLKKGEPALRTLAEAFLAIGVVFVTVAIPLALDGRWTSAAWALEGSAMVWIAIKQRRWLPRIFGLAIQVLAGFAFLDAVRPPTLDTLAVLNGFCLGGLLVALAGFFSSFCLYRQRTRIETAMPESFLALGWALLWWFASGLREIDAFAPDHPRLALALSFCALSGALAFMVGVRLRWETLRHVYKGLLPVMLLAAICSWLDFHQRPSIHGGWLAWPLAFLIHYRLLRRDEESELARFLKYWHLGLLLLLVALTTWEAVWWTDRLTQGRGVWPLAVLGVAPALFALGLCRFWNAFIWPLHAFRRTYLEHGLAPVVVFLWSGSLAANLFSTGNPWPLLYLPLLNPFDLAQALVFWAIAFWSFTLTANLGIQPFGTERKTRIVIAGATVFFWLNAVLIRTLHHWGGVPFSQPDMIASDLVQTSLSIFWTLSALALMFRATRKGIRQGWLVGAGLVGVVIVKLFVFDLAQTSTVERIISFIGVGTLCLAIGYLAPLPPRAPRNESPGE